MIGDTSNYLALAVKPVDVATPLLQAAKIKQSQIETQTQELQMQRDAIGAEARGLAPHVGAPDYADRVAGAKQRLMQQGVISSPQASAGFDRDFGSPLGLQSIIARTQTAGQAMQDKTLAETSRHNKAVEGHAAATAAVTALAPVKIGTDSFGGDVYAVRDPKTGGYQRIDAKTGQLGGAATAVPTEPGAAKLSGDEYLKTLDPERQDLVKKVANYEIDPRTFSTKGGHRERILSAVAQYEPNYDMAQFPARAQAVKAFATGPQGNTLRSFNVAVDHLETMEELTQALKNKDMNLYNSVKNKFQQQFGATAPGNFDAAKSIVGSEIAKAIVGGQFALQDREEIRTQLSNARSEDQLLGVIKTFKQLMAGQVKGLRKQYEETTGLKNFDSRLTDPMRKMMGGSSAAAPTNDRPEIADARTALAKGVPRAKVEAILKNAGVKFGPADLDLQ